MYFTDSNKPIVSIMDPEVIIMKSFMFCLYTKSKFFCLGMAGEIIIKATKYLRNIAKPTPAPKL